MANGKECTLRSDLGEIVWTRPGLKAALRKAGFLWKAGQDLIEASLLAQGCEMFLSHETDADVIRLYEFADRAAEKGGRAAMLVAA